jgi:hypothetical protein
LLAATSTSEAFASIPNTIWQSPCFFDNPTVEITDAHLPQCIDPPRAAGGEPPRALILVGDSHAAATADGLRRAVEGHFSFAWAAVGHNCALAYGGGYESDDEGVECGYWAGKARTELAKKLLPGDVLVYRQYGAHFRSYEGRTTFDFVTNELYPLTHSKDVTLVLVGDSPVLKQRATYCLPSRFVPNAVERCDTPREDAIWSTVDSWLQGVAGEHDDVEYFGLADLFCEEDRCRAIIPGTNTYWAFDEHHFTTAGGMYLSPFWCDWFASKRWFNPPTTAPTSTPTTTLTAAPTSAPIAAPPPPAAAQTTAPTAAPTAATPMCAHPSATGVSVYTPLHPMFDQLDQTHALSRFSTYTARGCSCNPEASNNAPLLNPPEATSSPTLPPCFIPSRPNELPMLMDWSGEMSPIRGPHTRPPQSIPAT